MRKIGELAFKCQDIGVMGQMLRMDWVVGRPHGDVPTGYLKIRSKHARRDGDRSIN
jgi:hypothetical protein